MFIRSLCSNFIAWSGDNAGSTAEHHLEVLGFDIEFAAASLSEASSLGSGEQAGTSLGAVAELGVVAVNAACVSCTISTKASKTGDGHVNIL